MKFRRVTAISTAALVTVMTVLAQGTATAEPTAAQITITGGALTITFPTADVDSPIHLGTRANSVSGGIISGTLGEVKVNDGRSLAAGAGWVASAMSTDFTPPTGPAIPATAVGYAAGPITKVGTSTLTANDPTSLSGVTPVVTATDITGDNSATWNPTITITVPGGMAANTYAATITHSVM